MINTEMLKTIIREKGYSQKEVANSLGIAYSTFYSKMKKRVFNNVEINALVRLLDISSPSNIFFADFVAFDATSEK